MSKSTRRKRRSAWASITELVEGERYRIRYWAETADGYRRKSCTVRGNRMEAEKRRAELMLEHGDDAPCPTVRQAWERWALPEMEQRVEDEDLSAQTLVQYRRWWAAHVEPRWGNVPCDQVRPLEVQQWISGLGRSQATNAMPMLSKAMEHAVRYGYVQSNPMRERYLMPPKSTVSRRDAGTWSLAELEAIWRELWGTWMEPAFLLAAFGGLRMSEALGPKAGEVQLTEVDGIPVALVPVTRQIEHHGGPSERLKNEQSRRTVAIAGRAATRLHELASAMPADWFLTNDGSGAWVPQERYGANWKRRGFAHPFRNLRNSWQTWMRWELKVPPAFIEPMMGHVIPGTTGSFYDRPTPEMFASVVAEAYASNPYDKGWRLG